MDIFGSIGFVWLLSAILTLAVGWWHGRANDALTLGVLLGPLGLVLAIRHLPSHRSDAEEQPATLPITAVADQRRADRTGRASEPPLRRAA